LTLLFFTSLGDDILLELGRDDSFVEGLVATAAIVCGDVGFEDDDDPAFEWTGIPKTRHSPTPEPRLFNACFAGYGL
jgi:hypothetical protein